MGTIIISKKEHLSYKFKNLENFTNFKKKGFVPFCVGELHKIVNEYTIVFMKTNNSVSVGFLTSFLPDNNLLINEAGKWVGNYLPVILQTMPFIFSNLENKKSKVLCYVEEYNCVLPENTSGEDFHKMFEENGEFSEIFKKKLKLTEVFHQNISETNQACDELYNAGLIVDWPIKFKSGEIEKEIKGLLKIDEKKLIDKKNEFSLKKLGKVALYLAYGQMFSKNNIDKLVNLHSSENTDIVFVEKKKSLREQVLDKQKKESSEELDQLVKNLIADE